MYDNNPKSPYLDIREMVVRSRLRLETRQPVVRLLPMISLLTPFVLALPALGCGVIGRRWQLVVVQFRDHCCWGESDEHTRVC